MTFEEKTNLIRTLLESRDFQINELERDDLEVKKLQKRIDDRQRLIEGITEKIKELLK